jgi:hypothetical protein
MAGSIALHQLRLSPSLDLYEKILRLSQAVWKNTYDVWALSHFCGITVVVLERLEFGAQATESDSFPDGIRAPSWGLGLINLRRRNEALLRGIIIASFSKQKYWVEINRWLCGTIGMQW